MFEFESFGDKQVRHRELMSIYILISLSSPPLGPPRPMLGGVRHKTQHSNSNDSSCSSNSMAAAAARVVATAATRVAAAATAVPVTMLAAAMAAAVALAAQQLQRWLQWPCASFISFIFYFISLSEYKQ